jgi:hypothetical protein
VVGGERRPRVPCPVCGREVALTAKRRVIGSHAEPGGSRWRCAGSGLSPAVEARASRAGGGGVVVPLTEAARARDDRRRVVLAERLAELETNANTIAKAAVELVTDAFPEMLEALAAVLAKHTEEAAAENGEVLERLIRADPERARRVLNRMNRAP